MCGESNLSPATKDNEEHDIAKDLRTAQLFTHAPVIGVFVMGLIMLFKTMNFKSHSAALILSSILLLALPAIVVSMKYHEHEKPPADLGTADVACASATFSYMFLILMYMWWRVGFNRSMQHICVPYLTGAAVFCIVYMLSMYGTASGNKKNKYLLMYHVNHLQWHIMAGMAAAFALMILFILLNIKYNV
jgi:MFS superfamily sulfate permease-like transporter